MSSSFSVRLLQLGRFPIDSFSPELLLEELRELRAALAGDLLYPLRGPGL